MCPSFFSATEKSALKKDPLEDRRHVLDEAPAGGGANTPAFFLMNEFLLNISAEKLAKPFGGALRNSFWPPCRPVVQGKLGAYQEVSLPER